MKTNHNALLAGALVLASLKPAQAQCTPPPPPSLFPGFLDEYLVAPTMGTNHWDLGGVDRERYGASGYEHTNNTKNDIVFTPSREARLGLPRH